MLQYKCAYAFSDFGFRRHYFGNQLPSHACNDCGIGFYALSCKRFKSAALEKAHFFSKAAFLRKPFSLFKRHCAYVRGYHMPRLFALKQRRPQTPVIAAYVRNGVRTACQFYYCVKTRPRRYARISSVHKRIVQHARNYCNLPKLQLPRQQIIGYRSAFAHIFVQRNVPDARRAEPLRVYALRCRHSPRPVYMG